MTVVLQSLRSLSTQGLDVLLKTRLALVGTLALTLGALSAYFLVSLDAGELLISILVVLTIMVIIVNNPLNGLLILLFFMAFIDTWIEIPLGSGIPDLSFSRFTIAFLSIMLLARASIGAFRFKRISFTDVCIIAAPLGIAISAPLAKNPIAVLQTIAFDLQFATLIAYFFAKNMVQEKKDLHRVLFVIALFGFVAGSYAIYEYTTGNVFFLPKGKTFLEAQLFRGDSNVRLIRGLMGDTGSMGRLLAMTIPVTFYVFFEQAKTGIRKLLVAGMLLVQFYAIIIAMSRTPWYALLIALFVMQLFYPQFRKLFVAILVVAVLALGVNWSQVSQSQIAARINDQNSTLEGRQTRWQAGYNMWRAKPIRGWGFGRFETEAGRFRTDGERKNFGNGAIENDYLHMLVGSGLIGFAPYLLFLLVPLIRSARLFFRIRAPNGSVFIKRETIALYWAVLLVLVITSYTAIQVRPVIKMMTFAVVGAVVGSHEHLLHRPKRKFALVEEAAHSPAGQ